MSEASSTAQGAGPAGAGSGSQAAGGSRMFTQEEVNTFLAKERRDTEAKFAGFEDFKAKAEKYDADQDAKKDDLQKAQDALAAMTAERDSLKSAQERAQWVNEVAEETKVPASTVAMLSGKDKEELMEQAKKLAPGFAEPARGEGGKPAKTGPDSKGEFLEQLFGR